MSNPAKPGWPDPAGLPYHLFGAPGAAPSPALQPLTQGLAGGMDLLKQFWGSLPGGAALPGFLVPTMDVEELDKRIKDLRAAESWVEVNLNMLRGTIQGLEVQRNTIAAIQSFSAMADQAMTGQPDAATTSRSVLPAGWPGAPAPTTDVAPPPADPPAAAPVQAPAEQPAAAPAAAAAEAGGGMLAGLAANQWLGFMQDQFAKVAQAALSPSAHSDGTAGGPVASPQATRKKPARSAAKKTGRRPKAARKAAPA